MKRTGATHFERFQAAVAAGDDARAESLVALLTAGDVPGLTTMAGGSLNQRWWALRALAGVGDARGAPLLVAGLADADASIRAVAALGLGVYWAGRPDAEAGHLESLAALLADDSALVRQAAADGLAHCGDRAVDVLAAALESPDDGVRVRAAAALHRIGSKATALPLYHHLDDPNPLVRHHAYETLSDLGLLTETFFAP